MTTATTSEHPKGWWESPWLVGALVLLSAVPLFYPKIPPLVDLLGHMGRYRVQLDLATSPDLQRYFDYHWAAIGNLGVDVLIIPLAKLLGLEASVKFITLLIPPLTVAGFLLVAREVHGRSPATAIFALPFALSYPFLFGFLNYALSMALALIAFAYWLRLERTGRVTLRALIFVPVSLIIFFTHTYGWGALGLLCFSGEAVRLHDRGKGWFRSGVLAAVRSLVLALPLLIMVLWRTDAHGGVTGDWFAWKKKWIWVYSALRDRWEMYDIACLVLLAAVALFALFSRKLALSRMLTFTSLVLIAAFVALPRIIFGSAYADMRLAPYVIAIALLAIRPRTELSARLGTTLAVLALGLFAARVASTTVSLAIAADRQEARIGALASIPRGARVATMVGLPCRTPWALPRDTHLGALVIVRRHGFSNDQWVTEGLNLLDLRYRGARNFSADPSQMVHPEGCRGGLAPRSTDSALRTFPRGAFDYLWMIDPPPFDRRLLAGMQPVWRGEGSFLYRLPK